MKTLVTKSTATENGTYVNTIVHSGVQQSKFLGTQGLVVESVIFYKTPKCELKEKNGKQVPIKLPNFDPEFFNLRVSHYMREITDEETGEVTELPATATWIESEKSDDEIAAILKARE